MTELVPLEMTLETRANGVARAWVELMAPAVELAKHVADTQFVPPGMRGKPDAIVACVLYGDELGLSPMQSLATIAYIDGRPAVAAQTLRALILAAGHELWPVEQTATRVTMAGRRRGDDRTVEITWTLDDARRAGLAGKTNWRAYPQQMLTARATADLARLHFADVIGGIGSTEEYSEEAGLATSPSEPGGEAAASPTTTRRRRKATPPAASATSSSSPAESQPDEPAPDTGDTARRASLLEQKRAADEAATEQRLAKQLEGSVELAEAGTTKPSEPETGGAAVEAAEATIAREQSLGDAAAADADEPVLLTEGQRRKLHALFTERGVKTREPRLAYCSTATGRTVETSNDLTFAEAETVIAYLEQWDPNDPTTTPIPF